MSSYLAKHDLHVSHYLRRVPLPAFVALIDFSFVIVTHPFWINGAQIEGNILESEFASFVGMYPLPMRHGMTVAELGDVWKSVHSHRARAARELAELVAGR